MGRVKFNVNTEYAYLQNFKILQSMYQRRLLMPISPSLYSSSKMPSRSTESSVPSLSSPSSNARCKIISSFFNGPSVTGTSIIQVATTMLSPDGKEPEALQQQQQQPPHLSLLVLLVPVSALPTPLGVVLHQQQHHQPREEQDRRRGVHPRLS